MTTLVGMLLSNRYRLDAQVGAGGMSTVYRAFDQTLERRVAIKLLHRQIADDPAQLERFRREARAVAQLSHPHIVSVIDAAEDEGRPQNVLIDEEGTAKITDFGIARTVDEEGLTADGRVLGTTDYCSPEQAMGHKVTGQSDLYSLGIVLFEMLTGGVPFHGENQVAVAMKHVRDPLPDVQELRPSVSATLAAVVDRATAKDLDRRYATDTELIADLEDALALESARTVHVGPEATSVLRTLPPDAQRRVPLRLRRPWWVALALLFAALAVAAVVYFSADNAQRGTGTQGAPKAGSGLKAFSLGQDSATSYDPLGDRTEHANETAAALDRDPNTSWSTENYDNGMLTKPGGTPGVGLYIDAKPSVVARAMTIRTTTPGWTAQMFAANDIPDGWPSPDWKAVSGSRRIDRGKVRILLDTGGRRFRYYLIWITALPPGKGDATISEVYLYEAKGG
jgi:serine/threonine-protein kinase